MDWIFEKKIKISAENKITKKIQIQNTYKNKL